MCNRFSQQVTDILTEAGWHQGRSVMLNDYVSSDNVIFPVAAKVVCEFGGLHVGHCGPGIECATSDVHIDPRSASHVKDDLANYANHLATKLFAIGEVHRGHGFLVIDESGKTYLLSDTLDRFASSIEESLERLLLGRTSVAT